MEIVLLVVAVVLAVAGVVELANGVLLFGLLLLVFAAMIGTGGHSLRRR